MTPGQLGWGGVYAECIMGRVKIVLSRKTVVDSGQILEETRAVLDRISARDVDFFLRYSGIKDKVLLKRVFYVLCIMRHGFLGDWLHFLVFPTGFRKIGYMRRLVEISVRKLAGLTFILSVFNENRKNSCNISNSCRIFDPLWEITSCWNGGAHQ